MDALREPPVYLLLSRPAPSQRAHFALFVPNLSYASVDPVKHDCIGTKIHVVGAPMVGFRHEFKHNYNSTTPSDFLKEAVILGHITNAQMPKHQGTKLLVTDKPIGQLDSLALQIQPPRASANFLGPVDGIQNRRCQEWTMDYIELLVKKGVLRPGAIELAQARRDPPDFGVGLKAPVQ